MIRPTYSEVATEWERYADAMQQQRDAMLAAMNATAPGETSDADSTAVTDWLAAVLRTWQDSQGLHECADDLRTMRTDLTTQQRKWLDAYCALWDLTGDAE